MKIDDVAGCNGLLYEFDRGGESEGLLVFSESENGMIECVLSKVEKDGFSPVASLSVSSRELFTFYAELSVFVRAHAESLGNLAISAMQSGERNG